MQYGGGGACAIHARRVIIGGKYYVLANEGARPMRAERAAIRFCHGKGADMPRRAFFGGILRPP